MNEVNYTILYCVLRTFVILFYYGSGSANVRNQKVKSYGSYGPGTATLLET